MKRFLVWLFNPVCAIKWTGGTFGSELSAEETFYSLDHFRGTGYDYAEVRDGLLKGMRFK